MISLLEFFTFWPIGSSVLGVLLLSILGFKLADGINSIFTADWNSTLENRLRFYAKSTLSAIRSFFGVSQQELKDPGTKVD